ncbi:redox-regulated ATPase YchF [Patescibacteria group bacterium]|nr:redox-regulated ATPase YchF [Patescibacteria group bacterium]
MNLSIGIVGLPNVGKSTLFNALLKKQLAFVANYPFATIEPNIGIVPVPDERLAKLAQITKNEHKMSDIPPIVPATVKFVDIAGLVKGAAQGEGLGNKFLSHIREVDAIFQVVRHFKTSDVHHVTGAPNPENDLAVINMELILADLDTLNKQPNPKKNATKEDLTKWEGIKKLRKGLDEGKLAKDVELTDEEKEEIKELQLLTMKPMVIVANVDEEDLNNDFGKDVVVICAKTEAELSQLDEDGQKEYLEALGLSESGLERIIKKGYEILSLISFLTAGEKEVRAWTIKKGSNAVEAAGTIHTDFMKKFIKAEIVAFDYFVENGGWKNARDKGKARLEGKEYIMKDGDVVEFKIGS